MPNTDIAYKHVIKTVAESTRTAYRQALEMCGGETTLARGWARERMVSLLLGAFTVAVAYDVDLAEKLRARIQRTPKNKVRFDYGE